MTIIVDLEYLGNLKTEIDETRTKLDENVKTNSGTPSDPRIHERLGDFSGDWDKRREELSESLLVVSDVLQAIHESFNDADVALTDALIGEAGS